MVGLGEARQEAGCGDGAAFRATDVGDVGEWAVELLLILIEQRQLPGTVIGLFARVEQLIDQRVVVAQQAGGMTAQCNNAGAGQGCDIDDRLRFEALGVGQCIAQHQTAFGVGVEDFDGLAAHGRDDVAWTCRGAARHVFGTGQNAHQIDRQLQFEHRTQGAEHTGCAAHVELHLVHARGRLDADAAGVEGDAFTDQHERLVAFFATLVVHDDEARRLGAALCYREERTHAQVGQFLLVVDFHFQVLVGLAQRLGFFAQVGRVADVRRQIAKVAGQRHAGGDCLSMSRSAFDVGRLDLVGQ